MDITVFKRAALACVFAGISVALGCAGAPVGLDGQPVPVVKEGWGSIWVRASAPVPREVETESDAKSLAREAAISVAQTEILGHVLNKRAKSGKTLAEAEIPYLELQEQIRTTVRSARVESTRWVDDRCIVLVVLDKEKIKPILRSW